MPNPRARVYWKQLLVNTHELTRYVQNYDIQLEAILTPEEWACVEALLAAAVECEELLKQKDAEI